MVDVDESTRASFVEGTDALDPELLTWDFIRGISVNDILREVPPTTIKLSNLV